MNKLTELQQKKDIAGVTNEVKEITANAKQQVELGRSLAEKTTDPEKKQAITDLCNILDHIVPQFVMLTKDVLANPNDPKLQEEYKKLKHAILDTSNQLALLTLHSAVESETVKVFDALNAKDKAAALKGNLLNE